MAKKIFVKYFPKPEEIRTRIKESYYLKFLGDLLHDPNLFHLNRHSVSGAFAIGLFMAYMPIPFQMLPAAILAIYFRVNLPISVSVVWISNPITMTPLFFLAYKIGAFLISSELQPFKFELSLDWIFMELGSRWRPFLLGCFVLGTISSIVGYISVRLLWRLHLIQRIKARKALKTATETENTNDVK